MIVETVKIRCGGGAAPEIAVDIAHIKAGCIELLLKVCFDLCVKLLPQNVFVRLVIYCVIFIAAVKHGHRGQIDMEKILKRLNFALLILLLKMSIS